MSVLVTGSIGIDTVATPLGKSENCIGGSAVYFSMAASFFSPVRFVGVVGDDCPFDLNKVCLGRDVDFQGLEVRQGSKTFRWKGSYQGNMSQAITDNIELNVLAEHQPPVPDTFKDSQYVFLANTHPALQIQLLEQLNKPKFVAADTMNCWIENQAEDLKKLLQKIDALIINDAEAKEITHKDNLAEAAKEILALGPKVVVIKKGEHGSILMDNTGGCFVLPAFPSTNVKDPTGAGDSFAGAFMGYLADIDKIDTDSLKNAAAYGTVTASLAIEGFSLSGLTAIGKPDIEQRFEELRKLTQF